VRYKGLTVVTSRKPSLRPRERAIATLRDWLAAGRWAPGTRISGELALVEELGVSRRTVRVALEAVQAEGLVASRGRGGRVAISQAGLPPGRLAGAIILLSHIVSPTYAGSYLAAVDSAALQHAQAAERDVLVLSPSRIDADSVRRDRPLGLVLGPYPSMDRALVERLHGLPAAGIPVIVLGDEPWQQRFDRIVFDHAAGGYAIANHFLARGRRRLACLWSAAGASSWQQERRRGIEQACRDAGLPPPAAIAGCSDERGDPTPERFAARVEALLPALSASCTGAGAPDALLAITDSMVYPCAAALRRLGRSPGTDLDISGYDGYAGEAWERAYEPYGPLISVDKDNRAAGAAMIRLLLDRAAGRLPVEPQRVLVAPRLMTTTSQV